MKQIKLYNADTLEDAGSIIFNGDDWEFKDVNDQHMIEMTAKMNLKAVLANLIAFNLVYDIITE